MERCSVSASRCFHLSLVLLVLLHVHGGEAGDDMHGGVEMGVVNQLCDNATWNLQIDWDNRTDYEYTCQREDIHPQLNWDHPEVQCLQKKDIPRPLHKCMSHPIVYDDIPPRGGPHRPLWPVYGEYIYVPPQRWLHSLEHGAAVFLYHPCADPSHIERLKNLARSCLWKHIITPYRQLTARQPFAVVTYGCRLMMGNVDKSVVAQYVREKALKGPEHTAKEGQYTLGLKEKSITLTDEYDSGGICPNLITVGNNRLLNYLNAYKHSQNTVKEDNEQVHPKTVPKYEDTIDRLAALRGRSRYQSKGRSQRRFLSKRIHM